MREILFKAKRIDEQHKGEWIEGTPFFSSDKGKCVLIHAVAVHPDFVDDDGRVYYSEGTPVAPQTVCQYTGITDRNGVKIFEGDIISYNGSHETVVYDTSLRIPCFTTGIGSGSSTPMHPYKLGKRCIVIGNIHDKEE